MDCGLLLSFSLCVVAAEVPWFGSQLSCFGHARAKKNSVLPCGLELCSYFIGIIPGCLYLLHRAVKGLLCCGYAVVGLRTVLAWPIVEGLVNPAVLVC